MRKFIFITLMIVLCGGLHAQDIITLQNGEEISAKVLEVTPKEVKYKKFDNPEGPIYTVEKIEVFMIKYENGSKDLFTQQNMLYANQQQQIYMPPRKSPGLAWFLSFLVPGVGQFYNGDVAKGFGFMGLSIMGSITMNAMINENNDEYTNKIIFGAIIITTSSWIAAQIDAPISANKKNLANGYLSWNLGNDTHLALQPEFKLTPTPINQNMSLVPTCGVGLTLSFK